MLKPAFAQSKQSKNFPFTSVVHKYLDSHRNNAVSDVVFVLFIEKPIYHCTLSFIRILVQEYRPPRLITLSPSNR